MIYLLFICCLAIYVHAAYRLSKVKKHDQVLFPFCQLRRDIISFIYESVIEKPGALSREDYTSVRQLLDVLNGTIHNYDRHKTRMFNIRKILKQMRAYRTAKKQVDRIKISENPAIKKFYKRFAYLLIQAFLAYTPLIRWELAIQLIGFLVGKFVRTHKAYFLKVAEQIRDDARHHGHMDDGAVAA